jgi:predicted dehydrogenase
VRRIHAYYSQDWLTEMLEKMGNPQAEWRTDPQKAGVSGCGGDIGIHAFMQARFVSGLEVDQIAYASLKTWVEGRKLDDDFFTVCLMNNGARAVIEACQVMIGHSNDLGLEITGSKGTIRWRQEDSEKVTLNLPGMPDLTYWRGRVLAKDSIIGEVPPWLLAEIYDPAGHNEGLEHAYAHAMGAFVVDVGNYWSSDGKEKPQFEGECYASADDGVKHMIFVHSARRAAQTQQPVIMERR